LNTNLFDVSHLRQQAHDLLQVNEYLEMIELD
jgi:hypothetical protein